MTTVATRQNFPIAGPIEDHYLSPMLTLGDVAVAYVALTSPS